MFHECGYYFVLDVDDQGVFYLSMVSLPRLFC